MTIIPISLLALGSIWLVETDKGQQRPILDHIGYAWNAQQLDRLMDFLENNVQPEVTSSLPVAGICPHDDHLFAADISYKILSRIKAKEIIIFGVTHRTARVFLDQPRNKIILETHDTWTGPTGPIAVSELREEVHEKLNPEDIIVSDKAHQMEHSIEAMLPLLQTLLPGVKITPLMITEMEPKPMQALGAQLGAIIFDYMNERNLVPGRDVFFLFSCDANHYGEDFKNTHYGSGSEGHSQAVNADRALLDETLNGTLEIERILSFLNDPRQTHAIWCGRFSVSFGLMTTLNVLTAFEMEPIKGHILEYSDSYTHGVLPLQGDGFGITAPFSLQHWVGHPAVLFQP